MKLQFFLLSALLLLLVACNGSIRGRTGKIVTEEREVSGFNKVFLQGSGIAEIIQGESESLIIEAEEEIMSSIESTVEDGVLILSQRTEDPISSTTPVKYTVTMIDIAGFEVEGSGKINSESVDTNIISLAINGSGDINIDALDGDSIDARIDGSGNTTLSGDVADQVVNIEGSGNYKAEDLRSGTAVVTIEGSGNATVWVDTTLEININGSGTASYYGDPILTQSVSGSGSVNSLGSKG